MCSLFVLLSACGDDQPPQEQDSGSEFVFSVADVSEDMPDASDVEDVVDATSETIVDSAEVAVCSSDEQCDDGDLCNGSERCKEGDCASGMPLECIDDQCNTSYCDPSTGCVVIQLQGIPCTLDNPVLCTQNICEDGICVPGAPIDLDDGDPCTKDLCEKGQVVNQPISDPTAQCDDGNPCTTDDYCHLGSCVGGGQITCTKLPCASSVSCIEGECVQEWSPEGTLCDDGDPCTEADACTATHACEGAPKSCDDQNVCTIDSCSPESGLCTYTIQQGASCDDGNSCTSDDVCVGDVCVGTQLVCDTPPATTCSADQLSTWSNGACDVVSGICEYEMTTVACPFGCDAQGCLGDPCLEMVCDDENVCTSDTCNHATGECEFTPVVAACDDGDACTLTDSCLDGECVGSTPLVCEDDNLCTLDICDAEEGCVHINNDSYSESCYDGPEGTIDVGICSAGMRTCVAGELTACIDQVLPSEVSLCGQDADCDGALLDPGEACDDGNGDPGDGCDQCSTGIILRVNTHLGGSYDKPAIAMLDDGYIVVWQSLEQDGAGWDIFGRIFNLDGTPKGEEFQINTYINGDQRQPSAAQLADGTILVAWTSDTNQTSVSTAISSHLISSSGDIINFGGEFSYGGSWVYENFPTVIASGEGFVVTYNRTYPTSTNRVEAEYCEVVGVNTYSCTSFFQSPIFGTGNHNKRGFSSGVSGDFIITWAYEESNDFSLAHYSSDLGQIGDILNLTPSEGGWKVRSAEVLTSGHLAVLQTSCLGDTCQVMIREEDFQGTSINNTPFVFVTTPEGASSVQVHRHVVPVYTLIWKEELEGNTCIHTKALADSTPPEDSSSVVQHCVPSGEMSALGFETTDVGCIIYWSVKESGSPETDGIFAKVIQNCGQL